MTDQPTGQDPEAPSTGSAWPDFSYQEPYHDSASSDPTAPLPYSQPYQAPAATSPLPYAEPDPAPGAGNYVQPSTPQPAPGSFYEPYSPGVASVTPYAYQPSVLPEHPSATTAMVLGLLSVLVFSPLGPFAWRIAARARAEIAATPGRWSQSTSLTVGYVTGIIGTIFFAFTAAFVIFLVLVTLGAATGFLGGS